MSKLTFQKAINNSSSKTWTLSSDFKPIQIRKSAESLLNCSQKLNFAEQFTFTGWMKKK